VIGIFPTLTEDGYLTAYKEWLAQEGADSIQLPESFDGAQLEHIFQTTNGFLIPGGGSHLSTSAQGLVERAVKANQAGDFYPVWGTCLGFEWIMEIFGGLAPEGCKLFNLFKKRAANVHDTTDYTCGGQSKGRAGFANHFGELLSASVVIGDAIRSLAAVDSEVRKCRTAAGGVQGGSVSLVAPGGARM